MDRPPASWTRRVTRAKCPPSPASAMPALRPDAPHAGAFASITSGRMPARARWYAADAPSIPAPTTITSAAGGSAARGSGANGTGSGGGARIGSA